MMATESHQRRSMRARRWLATTLISALLFLWCVPVEAQDVRAGVEQLAAQIVRAAPEGKQLSVAVADFPDLQGVTSNLGRYVASRLTTRLAQTPSFFVIERQRLGQVLAELKFSMSDLVDPSKAKQLGRMVGVEAIVVGTVSDLGNQVDLDARVIEIETNRMLLGASVTISKDRTVEEMLKQGRQEALSSQPVPRTPPTIGAAPSAGPSEALRGYRYSGRFFSVELTSVEVIGDEITLTMMYTNRTDSPHVGGVHSTDINKSYLIDNLGNRYRYIDDSFGRRREFAPQIPEQIWLTFGEIVPDATAVNLILSWIAFYPQSIQAPRGQEVQPRTLAGARTPAGGQEITNVVLRDIPLR